MADRFPLIANATTGKIEELASGDNLNLYDSSIVGAVNISANQFFGSLTGTATTSIFLSNAGNIVSGTINPDRLSGLYPINITGTANTANYLYDAQNIVTGIIDPARLSGGYDINIGGNAFSADRLNNAANIIDGVIDPGRLSGTYNISISGSAANATQSNFAISAGTATTSSVLTNASDILAGTISTQRLSGSYDINISGIAQTSVFSNYAFNAGIATEAINSGYASNAGIATNADYATVSGLANDVDGTYVTTGTLNVSGVSSVNTLQANSIVSPTIDSDNITSDNYYGTGVALVGIVTQISAGIGLTFTSTQAGGKGIVNIGGRTDLIGKTIFVAQNGNDLNTGLVETNPKRSIKAAIAIAVPGDTVRVYPGSYIEDNPIVMPKNTSIYGSELRNCLVTPANPGLDLFQTNDGCHIVNVSFVGQPSENQAAVVAFKPLLGVATDRFFDGARMIRMNLDFIASEAVGYLTSTDYKNPAFVVPTGNPNDCKDDIKNIFKAVCFDITRGGNSKCVGAGKSYYTTSGALQHITGIDTNGYSVKDATIDALNYAIGIAHSCINNVSFGKTSGGNYQNVYTQVKDLSMQPDGATNYSIGNCSNVLSAVSSCVGVVTSIIGVGLSVFNSPSNPTGIRTTYPGNAGLGITSVVAIATASYDNNTGNAILSVPNYSIKKGDRIEIRDLKFSCSSGGGISTQAFPSGKYGYEFYVDRVLDNGSLVVNTGVSSIPHTYIGGGFVVNRSFAISTATYDNASGITTISAPGAYFKLNDIVNVQDLIFSCNSGGGPSTALYPSGNLGYDFKVIGIGTTTSTCIINTGVSTISHTYVSGGVIRPPFSTGTGNINKGPYIRNCTNFIPNSIGMKVDGFSAEPGDEDDNGVTGAMSVDSYTQYNQGGIGVSITNGAYCQLVSIFTICDNIAIYASGGGQCDINNSNASFGNYGLYAKGVGDNKSKSIYRYTGIAATTAAAETDTIVISGVGTNRPYDGQALYFGELYYELGKINVTNGGSGYTSPPRVVIDAPTGPNGIAAEAIATIKNGSVVSVDLISTGNQYLSNPNISFVGGGGASAAATVTYLDPIYYNVESATLPDAGISTVVLTKNLNNTIGAGTTVYFSRLSLEIATTISFEWVGAGVDIASAKPGLGGVAIQDNEVVMEDGGKVVYTSTNQSGNFKIGDDLTINQLTGTISGRAFSQSLLNTVTPLIIALGR